MMKNAKQKDWVMIKKQVLAASRRAKTLPADTQGVPLQMWVKGFLSDDAADIGDQVTIETLTGRKESGRLVEIHPTYSHSFGCFVPELLEIGQQLRQFRAGGRKHE